MKMLIYLGAGLVVGYFAYGYFFNSATTPPTPSSLGTSTATAPPATTLPVNQVPQTATAPTNS